jgi:hypothetical protein
MSILDSGAKALGNATNAIKDPFNRNVDKTGLRGHDFPDGFRFQELTGEKQLVVMAGSWMPKVPFVFGGQHRTSKEYYAGNSEPTIHVLGSEEDDLSISGRFYDKRLPTNTETDFYGASYEMQESINEIRRRGNVLRIWLGEWQRYGFLTGCQFEMKRKGDIEYKLTFAIIGTTLPSNYRFLDKENQVPATVNKELIDKAALWLETSDSIPTSMPASISEVLNDAISEVGDALDQVTDFVDSLVDTVDQTVSSVNRGLGLIRYATNLIQQYKTRIGKIAFSFTESVNFAPPASGMTTGANLVVARQQASAYIGSTMSQMNNLNTLLASMRLRFAAISATVPLARYRVTDGDSLQKIAMKFYQNADLWQKIYDHNKLTTTALTSGSVLEIPKK